MIFSRFGAYHLRSDRVEKIRDGDEKVECFEDVIDELAAKKKHPSSTNNLPTS
jgi:hypothetical protein